MEILGDLTGASDPGVVGDAWHQLGCVLARRPGDERIAELAFMNAATVRAA
jgi:hypothetical protein